MKTKLTLSSLLVLSTTLVGCSAFHQGQDFTIMHTNDHHGHFWQNKYGEYGMAARKTLIDNIRQEVKDNKGFSLLFSGGDINTGVPESDMQDAEPDFKGMAKLGYDAMALGNHEFDNPLSTLMKQKDWVNFPFLSANIYDQKTGKLLFKPYEIFVRDGIKIAVIGLTTEDTMKIGNPEYVKGLEFRNPVEVMKKLVPEIKAKEHPDLIFAITHMGHYHDANHGVNAPGDVTLARSLPAGYVDMIIGGHSQNPVCMNEDLKTYDKNFRPGAACRPDRQNGTWIVQAYEWGKYVGRADFNYHNGKLVLKDYRLIPVNLTEKVVVDGKKERKLVGKRIEENQEMLNFLKPYQDKGTKALQVKVGDLKGKFMGDRNVVRFKQTNLGRFIAEAQAAKVHADFGIMNSGGVRDSIEPGSLTYKDVLKVLPFGNTIAKAKMDGKSLIKYLDVVATKSVDSGAYPQFSPNISMVVEKDGVHNVKINGRAVQPNKMYTFTVPSFNARGGDGYPKINFIDTGFIDADVIKSYIKAHSPVQADKYNPKNEVIFKN